MTIPSAKPAKHVWRNLGIGGLVLLVGAVSWFALATRDRMTLPTDPPVEITRFVATEQFVALSGEQKQAYVDRLEKLSFDERRAVAKEANLTPEEAKQAYRNVFRQAAQHRIDTYFSIPDDAGRRAYLDKLIDEYELEQSFYRREPPSPDQIKTQLESMPPGQREKAAQFLSAFAQRRIARGFNRMLFGS